MRGSAIPDQMKVKTPVRAHLRMVSEMKGWKSRQDLEFSKTDGGGEEEFSSIKVFLETLKRPSIFTPSQDIQNINKPRGRAIFGKQRFPRIK